MKRILRRKNFDVQRQIPAKPQRRSSSFHKTSQYTGVNWNKSKRKWRARIKVQSKDKHIGYFVNEEEAARAYDVELRKRDGVNAQTNFPLDSEQETTDKKHRTGTLNTVKSDSRKRTSSTFSS